MRETLLRDSCVHKQTALDERERLYYINITISPNNKIANVVGTLRRQNVLNIIPECENDIIDQMLFSHTSRHLIEFSVEFHFRTMFLLKLLFMMNKNTNK